MAVAIDIRGVYTNTPPTGPQRGVLNQVASYTMEAAMDTLARALDRDPVEVRLRNDSPWADPEQNLHPVARALRAPPENVLEPAR